MRGSRLLIAGVCFALAGACDSLIGLGGPGLLPDDAGQEMDVVSPDDALETLDALADGGGAVDAGMDSRCPTPPPEAGATNASVLEHHLHGNRDGAYVDGRVTTAVAASFALDPAFNGVVSGTLYAQPLYVDGWTGATDAIIVATDSNHVTALDAMCGTVLWDRRLGPPVPQSFLPCGGPYPSYGVTGTPVIDLPSRTLYVESFQTPDLGKTKKHYIYALSIDDGSIRKGWPVDVGAKLKGFDATIQNDRGGLTLLDGTVWVPYAGLNGDCNGDGGVGLPPVRYHGWVVGVKTSDPSIVGAYSTPAWKGGIWASVSRDDASVYAVTGNTSDASTWGGGEALIRFSLGAGHSVVARDYFTPSNWLDLDHSDSDLGSSASVLFDMPGSKPDHLAVAMGKAGVVHLLDRDALGHVGTGDGGSGEGLFSLAVGGALKGVAATYTTAKGRYVVVRANPIKTSFGPPTAALTVCPGATGGEGGMGAEGGTSGAFPDLLALLVTATSPPTLVPTWCAVSEGQGSPIATTSDGTSDAMVWIVSAKGSNRLLAFDGDTGAARRNNGTKGLFNDIPHWTSPIVAKGRFYLGGLDRLHAFTTK